MPVSYTHLDVYKRQDMTSGIDYYKKVNAIAEHFEEEKDTLIQNLKALCRDVYKRQDCKWSKGLSPYETKNGSCNFRDE